MSYFYTSFKYALKGLFLLCFSATILQSQTIDERFRVDVNASITIPVDTNIQGTFDNFSIERCFNVFGGLAFPQPPAAIQFNSSALSVDTLCLKRCNTDNFCDTLYYEIRSARAGTMTVEDIGEIEIKETIERCLPVSNLYETDYEVRALQFNNGTGQDLTITDSCFTIFTGDETSLDTSIILSCDKFVCDTFVYITDIRKYGSFQTTTDSTLALGSSYERCFDIENSDTFEITILSDISDNGSTFTTDGFCFTYQTGSAEEIDSFQVLVRDRFVCDTFGFVLKTEKLGSFQGAIDSVIALGSNFERCFPVINEETFSLTTIGDVSDFGTQLTVSENCFTYQTALEEESDTFQVVKCDNFVCDTFLYRFTVEQLGDIIVLPTIEVDLGEVYNNCLAVQEPDDYEIIFTDSNYLDLDTRLLLFDSCYQYETGSTVERDTLRFVKKDGLRIDSFIQVFVANTDTLDLPLFDDFSYDSPFPDPAIWINRSALVNKSFGFQAPNVGVITMDGLDRNGSPYNTGFGPADMIVSKPIDISTVVNNPDTLFLMFEIQPKGYGEAPENDDFVKVEFLDSSSQWVGIDTIRVNQFEFDQTLSLVSNGTGFQSFIYPVLADSFLHDHFQFRITNFGSNKGAIDIWNIDNIYFNKFFTNRGYRDVSFSKIPQSLLQNYTAMPRKHFDASLAEQLEPNLSFELVNFFDQLYSLSTSQFQVFEENTGIEVGVEGTFLGAESVVRPGQPLSDNFRNKSVSDFQQLLNTVDPEATLELKGRLSYQLNGQEAFAIANDTVEFSNTIGDYFAYDDGTAEYNLAAEGSGVFVALEYESIVADSLKNIQMHIQHVNGDVRDIEFKLYVWVDSLEQDPIFESQVYNPIYSDEFNLGLQSFTNYQLKDENGEVVVLPIPAGKFYIGWEQLSEEFDVPMAVGMDRNSLRGNGKIYTKTNVRWNQLNPDVYPGSLMIRPVFGRESLFTTPVEENPIEDITLYPNPTTDFLYVKKPTDMLLHIEVFNTLGQQLLHSELINEVSVANFKVGLYFARIFDEAGNSQVFPFYKQ